MLEQLYKAIRDRLSDQVSDLRLVDLDTGQLEMENDSYPIVCPAVFIDFQAPQWENTLLKVYVADVQVSIRLVFDIIEDMSNLTPNEVSEVAIAKLALQSAVHNAICGLSGAFFNSLTLISGPTSERRDDGLKVYEFVYSTNVRNSSASPVFNEAINIEPAIEVNPEEDPNGPAPLPPPGDRE